jgi:hypothetical protein
MFAKVRINSFQTTVCNYEIIGADLYRRESREIYVSANGAGTLWTVETPEEARDFHTSRVAFAYADSL